MSTLKIYVDVNYPKALIDTLHKIHELQKVKRFEIVSWKDQNVSKKLLNSSVFLMVSNQKRGLEIPILKHFEEGYRLIVCQTGSAEKLDFFEFAMTVLRIWPRVIEALESENDVFLYTFKYGGKRLMKKKV